MRCCLNLLRQYCDELEVVIPHKAHSAGTLISIGANSIIMTKQATLGPIDPSVNTPLNPPIPNAPPQNNYPVSVEAVKGYLAFAKEELSIKEDIALSNIMIKLSEYVHPLVLGQVYRARAQIKMLAEKLLTNQVTDMENAYRIAMFEKPLYLAVLTDDLKKALRIFIRYRERTERRIMVLIIPHKTFCGEKPVLFFLSHGERIHGITFHTVTQLSSSFRMAKEYTGLLSIP